jgi:hypothetical protein
VYVCGVGNEFYQLQFYSSHLLSKNVKIKIYKIINLLVLLSGCETFSLTLREEHRLKMSENRREYLDLRKCSNRSLEQTAL